MSSKIISDSYLVKNFIENSQANSYYYLLKDEVDWQDMFIKGGAVPRKISIQGEKSPDYEPLYRHPSDEEPAMQYWTPTVRLLRQQVSDYLNINFNHVLIQWYRDGYDWIGRHSDKTLDIQINTPILNLSFGATRTMLIRSKHAMADGTHEKSAVQLTDNSLLVFGWETNRAYHHQINQDKRPDAIKTDDELAYEGGRISLTFRSIATYRTKEQVLFGQGSHYASKDAALKALPRKLSDQEIGEQTLALAKAFKAENSDPQFDWNEHYGSGFDVVNMKFLCNK